MANCLVSTIYRSNLYRHIISTIYRSKLYKHIINVFTSYSLLQVQEYTDLQSPNTTSPSYSFAVELEALSIVQSSPEHLPDAICRELSGPGQVPSDWVAGTVDDAEMSNEEFKDLGDALASILASPSPQNSLSAGTPNRQSVIDGGTTAITTPRRGSEELCNGATEPLNSLSPLLSVDETALPAHSPLSSSLASCSSYEDIENSPQSTSQDIEDASETEAVSTTRANTRRKNSASSDSDDENAVVDENKSEKVIKLPQSKKNYTLRLLSNPHKWLIDFVLLLSSFPQEKAECSCGSFSMPSSLILSTRN